MRERYKKKRSLGILVLLTMLVQIFVPFLEMGKVYAKNGDQIVQNLEIVGEVKGEYRPGETIVVKGDWVLPDDSPGSVYKDGDSFSISIPKGLTPAFGKITLGDMGEGRVVGDKVIFTFNENIEQLMNRNGGFTLMFTVDTPDKEGESELPLIFKDDEGKELISENSKVNYEKGEVIGTSKENVGKGKSSNFIEDGLEWYIRLNWSNELKDEGWVTLVDNIVGDNHIIKEGSFRVESMYTNYQPVNKEAEYTKPIISLDGKQFTMDLKIEDDILYTIYYETKYVGDYSKDIENADKYNNIKLKNELAVYTKNKGVLYPGNKSESEPVEGEFNLGGWAEGDSGHGKLSIIKEDLATRKRLKGARFKVQEIKTGTEYTVETDDNGVANVINTAPDWLTGGKYIIKEVTAPEGYKLNSEEIIVNIGSSNNEEIVVTNEAILDININKEWLDYKGDKIPPQEDIAVQLLANGSPARQSVLTKDMDEDLIFKNLPRFDESGEEIKYEVKEYIEIAGKLTEVTKEENNGTGYTSVIEGNAEEGFTIKNTQLVRDIEVSKAWKDSSGEVIEDTSTLPEVTVKLFKGEEKIDEVILNKAKDWTYTFEDLPKYDKSGKKIEYTVKEVEVKGYKASYKVEGNKTTITNTKDPESEDPKPVEPEDPPKPDKPIEPEPEEPEEPETPEPVEPEEPENPEEDGDGSKNPNKPEDKEETEIDASQETKLPKTGSNSLDYYLLGLLLLLIGLLLKKRERVAN